MTLDNKEISIGDSTVSQVREKVIFALVSMASQGSVTAAGQVLDLLNEIELAKVNQHHTDQLLELANKPVSLAHYLGELGTDEDELANRLGRNPREEEMLSWREGHRDRQLEIRAIELARTRKGKQVKDWMNDG